ncbi:CUB domain-containing protein [Bdellovibrionota bacterium FG-1]
MPRPLLIVIPLIALALTGCKESSNGATAAYAKPSPSVSASATPSASPTATPAASPSPSATASATPAATPSASPTATPSATPTATSTPSYSIALSVKGGSLSSITANGSATTILQALVLDQDLNPAPGQSVTINLPASGGTSSASPATTNGSGIAEFTITSSTLAGIYSYTATANAVTSSSTSLTFTSVAPTLTVTPVISLVGLTATQTLSTSGGTGPYSYSIVSGPGDVNAASGLFTASSGSTGDYVKIKTQDSLGAVGYANITLGIAATNYTMCTNTTATASAGTLYDSGGAGADYSPGENCGFLITSLWAITASFDSLGTEAGYDPVKIYDGADTSGTLLGTFSGSATPANQTATSGQMYVKFNSDGSAQGTGFVMHWTTPNPTETSPVVANFTASPWAGLSSTVFSFTDSSSNSPRTWNWSPTTLAKTATPSGALPGAGLTPVSLTVSNALGTDTKTNNVYLGSLLAGNTVKMCTNTTATTTSGNLVDSGDTLVNYSPNENCTLLIQPVGATSITLSLSSIATEAGYDALRVYDGTDANGPLLGTFSGSATPAPVTGTSGSLYLTFVSDGSLQFAGFNASWTSDGSVVAPTTDFFASQTTIAVGETITLRDLSGNTPTSWAWDFENTGATDSTQQNPSHAFATAGAKTVKLTSTNAAGSNSQTKAAYITVSNANKMCSDTTSSATSGFLFDSGGPSGNYSDSENCGFLIQLGAGHTVGLSFSSFSLEEGSDFIKIYDGTNASGTPLHTGNGFTGANLPSSVAAQSGSLYLVMTTDSSVTRPGFKATWSEFQISSVAGQLLWLKADSLSLNDGDGVATWTDSSANHNDATQGTLDRQPIFKTNIVNGRPVIRFSNTNNTYLGLTTQLTTVRTAFIVTKYSGAALNYLFLLGDSGAYHFHGAAGNGLFSSDYASASVLNGSGYINGTATSVASMTRPTSFATITLAMTGSTTVGYIAQDRNMNDRSWDGDIAEIILYSTAVSDSDRILIEAYLRSKYSLP